MAKFLPLLLLALIAFSLIATTATANANLNRGRRSRYGDGSLKKPQCKGACDYRCSDTGYKNACLLYCNKCCLKCLCVPPGTYGNKQVCRCYNNWKTKEGGPKCP